MNKSIEIVWFDTGKLLVTESLFKIGMEIGEGRGERGRTRGNKYRQPVFLVLKS